MAILDAMLDDGWDVILFETVQVPLVLPNVQVAFLKLSIGFEMGWET